MSAVIAPLPAQNGRIHPPPAPEAFRPPGFRFVRWFLLLILITVGAMVALIGFLGWRLGMDVTVEAKGAVEPHTRRNVKPEIGGLIEALLVHQGQRVRKGDPIAEIDGADWRREKEKTTRDIAINRSRVAEIKAQMQQERRELDAERNRALQDRRSAAIQLEQVRREYALYYKYDPPIEGLTRPSIDTLLPVRLRQTALQRADADLERIRRRLEAVGTHQREIQTLDRQREKLVHDRAWIDRQLARTTVRAPIDGIVLTGDLHQRLGDRIQPGESLLELAEPGNWQVRLAVSEADIAKVRPGQTVHLYVNAFPHMEYKIFDGTITEVSQKPELPPAKTTLPATAIYPVKVHIKNPHVTDGEHIYTLIDGQSVDARIVVEHDRIIDLIWKKIQKTAGKYTHQTFYDAAERGSTQR